MNIFYAPPGQIYESHLELSGQEAKHASKVLRYQTGDAITVVDGRGGWYEGIVGQITKNSMLVSINDSKTIPNPNPELVLGLGLIKKRDRLEFAVEKAVELGVSEIALFRSRHTVKENVRMDRLKHTALAAMKQSLRAWLPEIQLKSSLTEVLKEYPDCLTLIAHEKAERKAGIREEMLRHEKLLLLIGPEGGFADEEINEALQKGGELISLGSHRLRTETAAITFISQFI